MKRIALLFVIVLSAATFLQAQGHWSFRGTVIRMRMTDCVMQRGFMATMSGVATPPGITCPEFTVMSDKVVYVVLGRRAEAFIPLAEDIEFLIRKNELVVFSDDEKSKAHFTIQQMTLRADWDRQEERKEFAARMMERGADYEVRTSPRASMVSNDTR